MDPQYRRTLRRHYGRLGFALLAYYAIAAAAQFAVQWAVSAWAPQWLETGWYAPALAFIPMYCIAFPVFLGLLPKAPQRELLPEKQRIPARELFPIFLMCLGILYPGNLVGQGADAVLRSAFHTAGNSNALETMAIESDTWAFALLAVILAPVLEELVFRKLLLDRMRTIDRPSALFFSALAFGLFHSNVIQFFYAFGVGILFGVIYIRTGRIRYSIVFHVLVNFLGSLATLFLLGDMDLNSLDMAAMMENLPRVLLLGSYVMLLIAGSVAGIVLLIRHRRSLRVKTPGDMLSRGDRFSVVFCQPGWILYCLAALAMTIIAYL